MCNCEKSWPSPKYLMLKVQGQENGAINPLCPHCHHTAAVHIPMGLSQRIVWVRRSSERQECH